MYRTTTLFAGLIACFSLNAQMDDNAGRGKQSTDIPIDPSLMEYNIIHTIPAPVTSVGDITFDGEHIWMAAFSEASNLYKISPADGSVVAQFTIDISSLAGVAYGDGRLFVSEGSGTTSREVKELDPETGAEINSWEHDMGQYTHGMQYHDGNLYINMFYGGNPDTVAIYTPEGSWVNQFPNGFTFSHGIAYDGCSFWITSNLGGAGSETITEFDPLNFNVLSDDVAPGGAYPNGICWDGTYLWIANNDTDALYQIDLSECEPTVGLNNVETDEPFDIWPNPATDFLYTNMDSSSGGFIQILDQQGRIVARQSQSLNVVDVSTLPGGVYTIRLSKDGRVQTSRFAKL